MERLFSEFRGRSNQIELLWDYFSQPAEFRTPEVFYVHGVHGTGKTSLITKFFSLTSDFNNFALVNCIECYTAKFLFESIISQLYMDKTTRTCSNILMLCDYIKLFYQSSLEESEDRKIVIILDSCEYLDDLGDDYMRTFSKLRQLTGIPCVTVIFISHLLSEKFTTDLSVAIPVYFPQYSKDELIEILIKDKPEKYSVQFYSNYVKAAFSIFHRITRDLSELKLLVSCNFTKYCEPLEKNICSSEDNMTLWRNIVPHLKASLQTALTGTALQLNEKLRGDDDAQISPSGGDSKLVPFDLPYFSKFFLIASYLASYNTTKHDKRLFLKNHGKKRRRKLIKSKENKDSLALQLLGPRMFPLDRLLAIFYSIIEDHPNLTANLLSQISTLVELRLLIQLADGVLDRPTYKCMASFSCVDSVARTVGFNISKYLIT